MQTFKKLGKMTSQAELCFLMIQTDQPQHPHHDFTYSQRLLLLAELNKKGAAHSNGCVESQERGFAVC